MSERAPLPPLPPLPLGVYTHYRTGHRYVVERLVRHSETLEPLAVYVAPNGEGWARPPQMFLDVVEHEGRLVRRFQPEPAAS